MAENLVASVHNIYTLRGAMVRDALRWSKYINEALFAFGKEAEVMIASHHWPRWGNDRVREVLEANRDIYAHLGSAIFNTLFYIVFIQLF
jgi:alkyl sulfatase BDS1-like metallo-beta-lactamase superfamily hydrolase